MKVKITNIIWDLTDEEVEKFADYDEAVKELDLPLATELSVDDLSDDDDAEDILGDALSDIYGYCFNSFDWEIVKDDEEAI